MRNKIMKFKWNDVLFTLRTHCDGTAFQANGNVLQDSMIIKNNEIARQTIHMSSL